MFWHASAEPEARSWAEDLSGDTPPSLWFPLFVCRERGAMLTDQESAALVVILSQYNMREHEQRTYQVYEPVVWLEIQYTTSIVMFTNVS